jgi:hypothetical protein
MNEALLKLGIQLWADLIAAHAFNLNKHAFLGIMVQNWFAGLLELLVSGTVDFLGIIGTLDQGLAGDIVDSVNLGRIETSVVDSAGRFMDPASKDSLQNHGHGGLEGDDQVNGNKLVERADLRGCSREAIEDERSGGVVGGFGRSVSVEERSRIDERVRSGAVD